jgi:hypothetical protein
MSNLTNQPPLGLKKPKPKKNEAYLREVRKRPCCVCERFGEVQRSETTAHHPIHERYGSRKVADKLAIPLCDGHHQGMFDNSKIAIHKNKKIWRETYGPDWSYSLSVQETDI